MADSRDILGKNRKFKGTAGVVMPKGSTAERVDTESGEIRFNTTTELMEYYDGNQWKPIDAPPTISSISTSDTTGDDAVLTDDGSTLFTVTITGGNFSLSPVVKFIGNTGTEYTAGNINRISNSSITCTTLLSMGLADDPYDVQVVNTSGLSATLDDAISFNADPVFVTASGSLGNAYNTIAISGSTFDASATDAEGDTITYSIASGSLPSGLTISSSTGYITGTPAGNTAGTFNFTVQAATAEGNSTRAFNIIIQDLPTGGTIQTYSNFRSHTFTSSGSFVVPNSLPIESLIVAGGGAGGVWHAGGGGAGGMITHSATLSPATYSIVIGAGGTGNTSVKGTNGVNTTAFGQTAIGGGAGGNYTTVGSSSGGSGGGGNGWTGGFTAGSAGTAGQGNTGGNGGADHYGGGGGGKGAIGNNQTGSVGGNGGIGATNVYKDGTSIYYAGGGGGGTWNNSNQSTGGLGGGGNGSYNQNSNAPTPGGINTGGGAGGSGGQGNVTSWAAQTTGGSGIVVVRYTI